MRWRTDSRSPAQIGEKACAGHTQGLLLLCGFEEVPLRHVPLPLVRRDELAAGRRVEACSWRVCHARLGAFDPGELGRI